MGDLIVMSRCRSDRSRPSRGPASFFFALGCPISYLAAERVERALGEIDWVPVPALTRELPDLQRRMIADELLAVAEREARALRLPLSAPSNPLADGTGLNRAAVYAGDHGAGARFALAASRLIFCGGFDLDDPRVVAEAAAAARLPVSGALAAAEDTDWDEPLQATAVGLRARGIQATPAIRIGTRWFLGLGAVPGASSFTAARALLGGPLQPAG